MRIPTRALFCENSTDSVTGPFAQYRIANVHAAFQARGFRVVVLTGTDDVRANFIPAARNNLTVYLGGIGHGAYTLYTGHGGNHILEVGQYDPAEVAGKSIHFLSCQTGAQLGPDTVAKGARSYAGYTENLILVWDDANTPNVNEFRLFAQADSTWDLQMCAGATAQQAFDATVQAFNAAAAQVPNTAAATYLIWDRDHLRLSGDPAARILPYRLVRVRVPFESPVLEEAVAAVGEPVE